MLRKGYVSTVLALVIEQPSVPLNKTAPNVDQGITPLFVTNYMKLPAQ